MGISSRREWGILLAVQAEQDLGMRRRHGPGREAFTGAAGRICQRAARVDVGAHPVAVLVERGHGNQFANQFRRRNPRCAGRNGLDAVGDFRMVGAEGFEPPTLCSQSRCATRLRYAPTLRAGIAERHATIPAVTIVSQPRPGTRSRFAHSAAASPLVHSRCASHSAATTSRTTGAASSAATATASTPRKT